MKLVTSEQIRRIDNETINNYGIPGPELMENAGRGVAQFVAYNIIANMEKETVAVICGKGNNGGDGFVVGRYLFEMGANVNIYFIGPIDKLSPDARLNFDRAVGIGMNLKEIASIDDLPKQLECDYLIDAIFGTGFAGSPRGITGELIDYINRQENTTIISVDLPSGLNADTGQHEGSVVCADYNFTMGLPKYGLYLSPGRELAGMTRVVPIGVPDEVIDKFDLNVHLITSSMVSSRLPERKPDGHKGDFGKMFVLAGSTGMTGAAALVAKAALRSGCGLVKVGCPKTILPIIATLVTEATSWPLPDVAKKGALALRGLGEIRKLIEEHDSVAIGPGIGQHHETRELLHRVLIHLNRPTVIDADGINAFDNKADLLKQRPEGTELIITPHPGEFKRLTGKAVPTDIFERIELAITTAKELNCVLVLKGSPTLVSSPDGSCYLNPTGNNGMASGGSGDVLTGAIGSFLAQGMKAIDAAVCGVYIHGLAGDFAASDLTERAMIAGDIVDFIPGAFSLFS
ncbi:MAG: bifunctional ADP-dependent NAD(P)H-hydrate dehydratase/NAD(P)H-hydrate epimerase [Candidatus Zixiibacteriota bacterium]|nr:MAG: bifunctional ADP-dependent NAD(P)H-hydrate dehydratase/NAD(P)H-hydrate epimerase [candidate division Zixibacteria bacterium]